MHLFYQINQNSVGTQANKAVTNGPAIIHLLKITTSTWLSKAYDVQLLWGLHTIRCTQPAICTLLCVELWSLRPNGWGRTAWRAQRVQTNIN